MGCEQSLILYTGIYFWQIKIKAYPIVLFCFYISQMHTELSAVF